MNNDEAIRIALVIPVYNGGKSFARCLEGVRALSPQPDEILIVDDGSTQWDGALLDRSMQLLRLPERRGPSAARNHGARAAASPVILFVDADVVPKPDLISRMREVFAGDPGLAAAFGSYDDTPGDPGFFSQYKNLFHHHTHQGARAQAFTFWCACGAIRREAFFQAGAFDERYSRPCIEDIELGYRLLAASYRIEVRPEIQVKHLKAWSLIGQLRTDFFDRALPWTELLLRKGQIDADLNLGLATRFKVALAGAMLLLLCASPWSAAARGWVLGLLSLQLLLDVPVFRFFARTRGTWFATRALLWHRHYYFVCGFGFAAGLVRNLSARAAPAPATGSSAESARPR